MPGPTLEELEAMERKTIKAQELQDAIDFGAVYNPDTQELEQRSEEQIAQMQKAQEELRAGEVAPEDIHIGNVMIKESQQEQTREQEQIHNKEPAKASLKEKAVGSLKSVGSAIAAPFNALANVLLNLFVLAGGGGNKRRGSNATEKSNVKLEDPRQIVEERYPKLKGKSEQLSEEQFNELYDIMCKETLTGRSQDEITALGNRANNIIDSVNGTQQSNPVSLEEITASIDLKPLGEMQIQSDTAEVSKSSPAVSSVLSNGENLSR